MSSLATYRSGLYKIDAVRQLMRWLDATPHPGLVIEIAPERVAAARFTRAGAVDGFAVENLPPAALTPSAIETNLINAAAV